MKSAVALVLFGLAFTLPSVGTAADQADPGLEWSVRAEPVKGAPEEFDLVLSTRINNGWILYSSDFKPVDFGPRNAKLKLTGGRALGELQAMGAASKTAKDLGGEYTYKYFESDASFRQRVRAEPGAKSIAGIVNGQACYEKTGLCTLFRKDFSVDVR